MRVLIGCEFSGIVREEFNNLGFNAWSCDLLPTDIPGKHLQCDIFEAVELVQPHLLIAHPPCTYLCNSGVSWLHKDESRWDKMRSGAEFFKKIMELDIYAIAIENPIMHKYAVEIIGERQDQVIQPWQFGHGETKATCLWLKNLPKLEPTNIVSGRVQRLHKLPPSKDRSKLRSTTYQGIGEAFANQWGNYLRDQDLTVIHA
jgi:hypothetical protein